MIVIKLEALEWESAEAGLFTDALNNESVIENLDDLMVVLYNCDCHGILVY